MQPYPFLIRGPTNGRVRRVNITASSLTQAVNKVLALYPNKFVNIKHARRMDLISAKQEAAKVSKSSKRKTYVFVDGKTGECDISHAPLKETIHCYLNGSEIAVESKVSGPAKKEVETKNEKTMSKKESAKPAKKAIAPAPKVAPKKETPAPKKEAPKAVKETAPAHEGLIGKATTLFFNEAQWKKINAYCRDNSTTIRDLATSALAAKLKV